MSYSIRAPGQTGLALAVLTLCACGAFGPGASEFPDAGPNGPDSLYAGVGQGIPFGEFALPPEEFRAPSTGAVRAVSRESIGSVLTAAQAGRLRLVLSLAGSGDRYSNADGSFNLDLWKARIDAYRDVDFAPYVTEGLVLAHFLMDEPGAPGTWGGQKVSGAVIEEMARYSKSIWPTLPTAVRAPPHWLLVGNTDYQALDIAWAQWAGPDRGGSAGLTPEQFRDRSVAEAKQLRLGLIFGLNYLNGGDGSSGVGGTSDHPELWQMSAAEILHVGTVLASAPYSCAFLSWRFDPAFRRRTDVAGALDSVAGLAATRGGTSCVRHDTL